MKRGAGIFELYYDGNTKTNLARGAFPIEVREGTLCVDAANSSGALGDATRGYEVKVYDHAKLWLYMRNEIGSDAPDVANESVFTVYTNGTFDMTVRAGAGIQAVGALDLLGGNFVAPRTCHGKGYLLIRNRLTLGRNPGKRPYVFPDVPPAEGTDAGGITFGRNTEFRVEDVTGDAAADGRIKICEGEARMGRQIMINERFDKPSPTVGYDISRQRIFPGFDGTYCKIQPSIATDGKGTFLLGFQRLLLSGMDVFHGQFLAKSTDGGKTWSEPIEQTALADAVENGLRAARYATVRYSRAHGKWFALGMKQLYENDKVPFQKYVDGRPYGTPIYVSVDVEKGCFTGSKTLAFPFEYEMALPFGQMLECDNGDLLACFYYRPVGAGKKSRCVAVRYAFEEDGLRVVEAGTPVVRDDLARGVCEPSLARLGDKVYMTVRSDEMGLWCVSDDGGMTFSAPRPWTWTDGKRIGNRNTQQHWMMCGGALFLAYTREDAANRHVFRNRAPIYMSQFDPVCGGLVRKTEFPIVPELGARLGNFCVDFTGSESWLVTAEWMQPLGCEKYGSDNSIWLVKVK